MRNNRLITLQKWIFPLLINLLLAGCAENTIWVDRAVILNKTVNIVSQIEIQHHPTGKIGEVSAILPGQTFSLGVSRQPYHGQYGSVSWFSPTGHKKEAYLHLPQASEFRGETVTLFYTLFVDGSVSVELRLE